VKKKGSALRKALVIIAVIAVLAGAMFGARAVINGKRSVGVIHVMDIADTWIDYSSQGYGQISQGGIQQVWNDTSMLISKIYVSEGDSVKKGDPLIQYDTAQAELRADDKRIEYEMARRDLSNAQERLAYIKTFRANQKPEPELKLYQDPVDIAVDENGQIIVVSGQRSVLEVIDSEVRRIIIDVNTDTPITRRTFETLLSYDPDVILPEPDVPEGDGKEESGQQDPADPAAPADPGDTEDQDEPSGPDDPEPDDPEPVPPGKEVQPQREFIFRIWANCPDMDSVQIASVSNNPEEDGIPRARWLALCFGHEEGEEEPLFMFSAVYGVDGMSGKVEEAPDELIAPVFVFKKERDSAEVPETERYTQGEINRMLQEQNALVRDLNIEVAQAELDWREAKQSAGDGIVRAAHDGVVVSVRDPYSAGRDEAMIQVSSGEGYQIISTISEMQLQEVRVGDHIQVMMWSNGMTYDGTIVKISPYPTQYSMSYSSGGNMSYYQFTADLDCQDELQPWDGGEIRFGSEGQQQGDTFAIEACFVREENGRSYVLAADEDDRLYKKYVEIGRILYGGWSLEITGGLSLDDYIAFPYGKNAVEGARADRDAEVYKW
jgi:multidrug resistance efflux pump